MSLSDLPSAIALVNGVPGPLQVTVLPPPIAHSIRATVPTASIATPPIAARLVCGPVVVAPGSVTHIQIGTFTIPTWPPLCTYGETPNCGATKLIVLTTRRAASRGSIVRVSPGGRL